MLQTQPLEAEAKVAEAVGETLVKIDVSKTGSPDEDQYSSEPETKAALSNFWRILSFGSTLDRVFMVIATFAAIGTGVSLPLMNVVFGRLVGSFSAYFTPGTTVSESEFLESVAQNALYIVYLFIAKFVLGYISMFSFRMTGIRISAAIRLAYLTALFHQPINYLDRLPPGQATDLITTAANTIQVGVSDKLSILVGNVSLVVGAYVVAFKYSWALTLVSSSTVLFIVVAYGVIVPFYIKGENSINFANEKASAIAGEVLGSIRTVKALCAEETMKSRYSKWIAEAKRRGLKLSLTTGLQFAPAFFGIYANFALTFWFGVKLYSEGTITSVGTVVIVMFSVILVVTALGGIAFPITGIVKAAAAATNCFEVIDMPTPDTTGLKDPDVSAAMDIQFKAVTFAYPSRPEVKVLDELNLSLPAGKVTAIVGPSGSGKSTVVGLLERWYQLSETNARAPKKRVEKPQDEDPEEKKGKKSGKSGNEKEEIEKEFVDSIFQNSGSISVGGHDIEKLDVKWWRSQIGLVQQEPFLFNNTIYTNVAQGLVGSRWEDVSEAEKRSRVEDACEEAFADEFIKRLPQGYETKVGESGIKLSGGQRQRLAIARSIIKRPAILILDEATSSIDVRGERIVQAALDRVSKNRTTITIAHRLSTIKKADHIVVLKNGKAAEEGNHDSLLALPDGVYSNLVRAQFLELGATDADEAVGDIDNVADLELAKSKSKASEIAGIQNPVDDSSYVKQGFFNTVGRFLYEQKSHMVLYALTIAAATGAGASYAIQSYIFAQLISVFQDFGQQLINAGNFWALMFFVLSLAVAICYFTIGYTSNSISVHVSTTYRRQYFESMLVKSITFFDGEGNSSGTLTSRLSNDPRQIQEILGINMAFPLIALFNILGCTIIAFYFGWKLTLVTFFAAMPVIIGAAFMRIRNEVHFEEYNAKVFAESSQFASESIGAFRTVTALTLEDKILGRYSFLLQEHVDKAFKKARTAVLSFALADSIELPCMALSYWYGGQLLGSREYNVIQFFVIYVAVVQGAQAAGTFLAFGPNIAQATAAANRILAFRAGMESLLSSSTSTKQQLGDVTNGIALELKDIYFQYPTRDVPVFVSLNLSIARGQFVAFVGPSGCGKTTVVSLLERFYPLQSGTILANGVDISTIPLAQYRSQLALVSQEPSLFQGTVRANLLLGISPSQQESITDEEVHDACRAAEIHDFITSLPDGYGTVLQGATHASLSGGQKQRVCIARALLRKPKLLLLDEATSSLDSQSEKLVQTALERVAGRRDVTVVVVAHRLATVQRADLVVVLGEQGGRSGKGSGIVEMGTHRELIAKRGVYYGMCQAQALDR